MQTYAVWLVFHLFNYFLYTWHNHIVLYIVSKVKIIVSDAENICRIRCRHR